MLLSGAVAGLVGMPLLLRRGLHLRHDLPVRARLRRHRHRPARPQQPGRHRLRRAAVRFLDEQSNPLQILAGVSHGDRQRSSRASSCSPSSSPTRSSAATASRLEQQRGRRELAAQRAERRGGGAGMSVATAPAASRPRPAPPQRRRAPRAGPIVARRRWRRSSARGARVVTGADDLDLVRHARARRIARRADRAGRSRRALVRAGRRRQHRPRGHDDPRHLGRRLLRLPLRARGPACSARSSSGAVGGAAPRGRHRHLRRRPHRLRCRDQHHRRSASAQYLAGATFAGPRRAAAPTQSPPLADLPTVTCPGVADAAAATLESKDWFFVSDVAGVRRAR